MGGNKLNIGDIVFARVRGFPFWPARIFSKKQRNKFKVVFYGTYERASLKANDLLPYTEERKEEFYGKYNKRQGYVKGLEEIENTPDILYPDEEIGVAVLGTPKIAKKTSEEYTSTDDSSKPSPTKFRSIPKTKTGKRKAVNTPPAKIAKKVFVEQTVESGKTQGVDVPDIPVQRSIWARVKETGKLVELPLDKDRPLEFDSEEQKLVWEMNAAREALKLKQQIEDGSIDPESLARKTNKSKESDKIYVNIQTKTAYIEERKNILKCLLIEKDLENLDVSIKKALHLESPDPQRCLESLEELLQVPVTPLILKKHSHIVQLIKRLRKYIGPDGMSPYDEISKFIPVINKKAEEIFEKFKAVFNYVEKNADDGLGFLEEYRRLVTIFDKKTEHLEDMEIVELITDPTNDENGFSEN